MRGQMKYIGMVVGIALAMGIGTDALSKDKPLNVILIGWDGAQRDHVKECLARNELPNLKRLSDQGALVAIDILRQTDTKAGWTQILTGYAPEITGVYSNSRYQPIPAGYTVSERLEDHFGDENIATLAVIGKKGHVDADPPGYEKITTKKGAVAPADAPVKPKAKRAAAKKDAPAKTEKGVTAAEFPRGAQSPQSTPPPGMRWQPGKPYYNASRNMDVFQNGLQTNDNVGSHALALLDEYKGDRFFMFVHFAEVDHSGHAHGENSKEYNNALISSDRWTGRIMDKLNTLGIDGNTLIYVTADHGFDEDRSAHADAPYVFLATNDKKVARRGERADITPTILDRFGLDLSEIEPPLSGRSLLKEYRPHRW